MSTDRADFSRREFRSPDNPDRNWLDWFREEYSRQLFRLDIEPNPGAPFKLETAIRMLPDLAVARSVRSSMHMTHRGDTNDDVSLMVLLSGRLTVEADGKSHEVNPGMAAIGPHGIPLTIDLPAGAQYLSVRLRRRLLGPPTKEFGNFAVLRDTRAMRLLLGYLNMIEAEDKITSPEMRRLVTAHVHDLAALACGSGRDAEELAEIRGVRAARLAAIKEDVARELLSSQLSVATVAARQGVSPRYVHMLFEMEGVTFSEFVVGQRLVRAHRMLGDPRYAGHTISAIALMVGFGDLSYFNRTFRRHFGASPSDARAAARSGR
jgi:AraC-like DNA-binding protein